MSLGTTNQSYNDRPSKITLQTLYRLSMKFRVSVTVQTVRRTLQNINLYGQQQRQNPLLSAHNKSASLNFPEEHENESAFSGLPW